MNKIQKLKMNIYDPKPAHTRPVTRSFGRDITNTPLEQPSGTESDDYATEIFQNLRNRE